MSLRDSLMYHLNVSLLGHGALRIQRIKAQMTMNRQGWWHHEHLNPPPVTSAWLKELISRHYLKGRWITGTQKVAWVTSGAPIEFLKALGYYLIYPENHGAVCGIRRVGDEKCKVAEHAGWSRDICSYARTDIGTILSGKTPVGKLPKPDLLVCCTNICQTVLYWYQVLAQQFKVPLILIDTPFLYSKAPEHALDFVEKQIQYAIETAEKVAGVSMEPKRLRHVTELSHDAVDLWNRIMHTGRARPAPFLAFDEFIHMAPIVEMRGDQATVDYYRALLAELEARIKNGTGALKEEKKRVLWDNLPIWFVVRKFGNLLASRGVALVASTYTNAWGELADLIDPHHPIESMAKCYIHPILNRGTGQKLQTMKTMIEDYEVDGVLLHSDRSCKPYSIGQMDQQSILLKQLGIPALLLEADHNDSRVLSWEQSENRLQAFFEVLGV